MTTRLLRSIGRRPTTASQQFTIRIINAFDPLGIAEQVRVHVLSAIGSAQVSNPAFDLNATGFVTSLGAAAREQRQTDDRPVRPVPGAEGGAVSFPRRHSQCPIDSYVWEFSNGTKSFGPTPQRTFADNGVYDGQLTVTDVTGLRHHEELHGRRLEREAFGQRGPDTTADWGRLVQFNGQATDPGSSDQGTLQYAWSFGDGTPSATGGPGVTHSYATPGDYVATLQVCDKDGGCDTDTRSIHVTVRDTTLGYTGSLSSSPSKTVALSANLVDEYGQPVVARR